VNGAVAPEQQEVEFAGQVRGMFDRIAGVYDVMNTAMTAGLHHAWRERAADRAELGPGDVALDACCGTGDFAFALARHVTYRNGDHRDRRLATAERRHRIAA